MEQFPDIPLSKTEQNIIFGYRDDQVLRQELNRTFDTFKILTEEDLREASPTIRTEFANKVAPSTDARIQGFSNLSQANRKEMTDAISGASGLSGELDFKTSAYYSLYRNTENVFIKAYNEARDAGYSPQKSWEISRDYVKKNLLDKDWVDKKSVEEASTRSEGYEKMMARAFDEVKPEDKAYALRLLSAPQQEQKELLVWANGGGKGAIPYYYQVIAAKTGVLPKELAWKQAAILGYEGPSPDIDKEISKLPIPQWLLKGYLRHPTKNKNKRLAIDAPEYVDGEYKPDEYYKIEQVHPYEEEEDID